MSRSVPRSARAVVAGILLTLIAALLPARPAVAGPTDYVTLSDGTSIAINVRMPDNFQEGKSYPTVFEMSGYDGGSADGDTPFGVGGEGSRGISKPFNENYVTVHASVRGTGCSSGEFDLFSWRSALDGRELIEWIGEQGWSNGEVGIYGHSYGGITGFMVAATQPPNLTAVSVSGLIDDMYRGMVYPGGVSNYGFPLLWTGGLRNVYDEGGGTYDGAVENQDPQCAQNAATQTKTVLNDPIVQGLTDTDNNWWQSRSLINYANRIEVPIHIAGAFQDEQTGPRWPVSPVRGGKGRAEATPYVERRSRNANQPRVPGGQARVDGSVDPRREQRIRELEGRRQEASVVRRDAVRDRRRQVEREPRGRHLPAREHGLAERLPP